MKHLLLTMILVLSLSPLLSEAATEQNKYVRTANYFLISGHALDEAATINTLSEFDLLILPAEAQVYNKTFFQTVRSQNPDIIILAYVPAVSWNHLYWNDPLHQKLRLGIRDSWWLKDESGTIKSVWPGTSALNVAGGWNDYLAQFVNNEILSTKLWDGVFYDEVQDSISWVGVTDVNTDGRNDSASDANTLWAKGFERLFSKTRELIGDKIMITNGSSNAAFAPYVNGRMYESFPSSSKSLSTWSNSVQDYLKQMDRVTREDVTVVNVNTDNTGAQNDYQNMRFGITSTLLGNGYFAFDFGDKNHGQLWTYDEYAAKLGLPKSSPTNALAPQPLQPLKPIQPGVWERNFEQGKVLVNATQTKQTVRLDGEYEKLHGTQDTSVNDGSIVSRITLESKDGIILLRPIEQIDNATFVNGTFARIFNSTGVVKRTGFFAYEPSARGGTQVVRFDTDLDGQLELIVADKTYISIFEPDGTLHARFAPYTDRYKLGINIALGDLENDGTVEIVTGTEKGGGPQLRIFNKDGNLIHPGFFAYDKNFRGGVKVSIGDLNGDGTKEIVTGPGIGGGPHVRVFHKDGHALQPGFFAYDKNFKGGVIVAAGDVNGDGKDEIITGPGVGGGPHVRVFNLQGQVLSQFYAVEEKTTQGMYVAASDLDGDGVDEILGFTSNVFTVSLF